MKAARLHGRRDIRVDDLPDPGPPGPGEVLLAVRAVGLCGSDIHYYSHGRIGEAAITTPLVMGHEPAGEVLAVGDNVANLRRGMLVAIDPAVPCGWCEWCASGHPNLCPHVQFFGSPPVDGALRERLLHPADCCFPLPEDLTAVDGALCETLGVGLHAVNLSHLQPGWSVAIVGCGPVGLMCLQVARCAGANPIIALDLVPERLAVAQALGADLTINVQSEPPLATVTDFTARRGVDAAFDCATSADTPGWCCELARIGGRVVLCGIPPHDKFTLSHAVARRKGLTVKFARRMKHAYPRAIQLAERGMVQLDVLATHTFAIDEVPAAFDLVERRADGVIKAVIEL